MPRAAIAPCLVGLCLLGLCLVGLSCTSPEPEAPGAPAGGVLTVQGSGSLHLSPETVYGHVPDFTLVDSNGSPFGLSDLRGRVWIADLIFTNCAGPCPMMTARMAGLQTALEDVEPVRLVSITVDPLRDTPEVLADYAARAGARPGRWSFLTGPSEAIGSLARDGFALGAMVSGEKREPSGEEAEAAGAAADTGTAGAPSAGEPEATVSPFEVGHSQRFVLVDGDGAIRGYYNGLDPTEIDLLIADARTLAAAKAGSGG